MKKLSLLFMGFCTFLCAMSQSEMKTTMAKKTYFGIKAGVNLAEFRMDNINNVDVNMKTSIAGGFFANIPLGTSKIFFQPEIIYTGVGSKIKLNNTASTISSEQDLSYIALPLMFQIKSAGGVFVELGPQAGYLIRAESESGNTTVKNMSNFDRFDLGLNGGLGWMSRVGLGITARYTLGLTNVIDDGGGNNSSNNGPEYKNSVIHIGLIYAFGAHK